MNNNQKIGVHLKLFLSFKRKFTFIAPYNSFELKYLYLTSAYFRSHNTDKNDLLETIYPFYL